MSTAAPTRVLFVDRDGTLIEEPADKQVDAIDTESFPYAQFEPAQQFVLDAFTSQGIEFDAVFVCPHRESDGCECRKPGTALVSAFVRDHHVDLSRSAMVGDRDTDLQFAR